ncbi:glycosyltransferase family 61 protein [Acidimangrovimonas sediminis]|uniref:Glycosyltransferase family 61 protein n=2 Tax=Albidovulum sediminis TaxID=3066345 RepID=A0ABT2NPG1_9RHOB|nr:glycosyltransferase family 61 protein [Defluviimonas sediminis]
MDLAIGYKGQIVSCEDALLVPWGDDRDQQICHVTDPKTGRLIFRHINLCDLPQNEYAARSLNGPRERLRGTYILAGYLSAHLGHCLVGTISSLWPLSQLEGQIDGIVSFRITASPRQVEDRNEAAVAEILRSLGIHLPIFTVRQPTQVDRLILAEKGIGSYKLARGSSYYHRFMRQRLSLSDEELGKKARTKLYITRSQLQVQRRGIVGEAAIDRTFAAAGYEVVAPEKLPLSEQIAKYQTADAIVGLDGTPFHLIPSVCPTDAKIAIIRRRFAKSQNLDGVDFAGQFEAATGTAPTDIDCINGEWRPVETAKASPHIAVLDFEKVYQGLVAGGFLDTTSELHFPSSEEIQSQLDEAAIRIGAGYEFVDFRFSDVA